jgi:hypothetical protein
MADEEFDPSEVLVTPISSMIESIGTSVAAASLEIHRAQLETIRSYPEELREAGLMPTLFHMQAVEVELKLKLALHLNSTPPPRDERGLIRRGWDAFWGTPVNAEYTSGRQFEASGASTLRMRFAPGPPPEQQEGE